MYEAVVVVMFCASSLCILFYIGTNNFVSGGMYFNVALRNDYDWKQIVQFSVGEVKKFNQHYFCCVKTRHFNCHASATFLDVVSTEKRWRQLAEIFYNTTNYKHDRLYLIFSSTALHCCVVVVVAHHPHRIVGIGASLEASSSTP